MTDESVSHRENRASLRLEKLESRVMLSASPHDAHAPAAHVASAAVDSTPDAVFDLGVTGTEIQFSYLGTPSYMAGTISYVASAGHNSAGIGRYEENLTPIFMDVNGDAVPEFIGTNGVATFSFYAGSYFIGSITTVNTSFIQGMTAAGEMLVASTGTVTAASGLMRGAAGGFSSQSVVGLFPTFAMKTAAHFVMSDYRVNPHQLVKLIGAIADSLAETQQPKLKVTVVEMFHLLGDVDNHGHNHDKNWHSHDADTNAPHSANQFAKRLDHVESWISRQLDRWADELADCRLGSFGKV
jgi:hypothetical protein